MMPVQYSAIPKVEAVSKYVTVLVKRCSTLLDNMTVNVKFSLSVS